MGTSDNVGTPGNVLRTPEHVLEQLTMQKTADNVVGTPEYSNSRVL